ncbi:HdeD family acid-resistance protein [Dietzia sp. ANT_WB102]|uniref:HdeD family acid-resistance protein n=1 Tax=Dietzia sp. ANT_WB102 TaxID=2597345 RepID=UPI0011EEF68B|nr:DUF308 domain-containing protein [Dietzia sp. ANT_WB102]KAA0918444.1 hypothetical protein FQ137_03595 [Dietzia sp. ANT_WB102]
MSTPSHAVHAARRVNPFRAALLISGLIALGFGIAVLVWPVKTALAVTGVLAVYAIAAGIVYITVAFIARWQSTGSRIGHSLLGLLFILAGVYAFASLRESAVFLALFVTVMIGVMWIVEGFTALFALGETGSTAMTIIFAIISVLAGFALLSTPVWGAGFLWWFFAISLVVLGVLNVVRALPLKN